MSGSRLVGARCVISETGGDLAQCASARHLASWTGCARARTSRPEQVQPAPPGNSNLKRLLGIAAMVTIRRKDSYLAVLFRRIAAWRGRGHALAAGMHIFVIAITSCTTRPPTEKAARPLRQIRPRTRHAPHGQTSRRPRTDQFASNPLKPPDHLGCGSFLVSIPCEVLVSAAMP